LGFPINFISETAVQLWYCECRFFI